MKKKNLEAIFEEIAAAEKAGHDPRTIYAEMPDADRDQVFKALTVSSANRTAARMDSPDRMMKLVRENLDDVTQAAHMRFLEAVAGDTIPTRDGRELAFAQIVGKACSAAITHAWREIYSHPTAAAEITDADGKVYNIIDIYAGPGARRPAAVETRVFMRETIKEAVNMIPATHRDRARDLLKLRTAGYNNSEIARRLGCSERNLSRIEHVIKDAARLYEAEIQWTEATREVIEALHNLLDF